MKSNSYYYEYHLVSSLAWWWKNRVKYILAQVQCSDSTPLTMQRTVSQIIHFTGCHHSSIRHPMYESPAKNRKGSSQHLTYYHCFFGFFFPQIVSQVFKKLNWSTLVGRKNFFLSKTRGILAARKLKISVNHVEGLLILNPMAEKITYIGLRLFWNTLSWFSMYFKFVEDTVFIVRNGVVVNPAGTQPSVSQPL